MSGRPVEWLPVDTWEDGFGWLVAERKQRASHALRVGGRMWVIDPVEVPGAIERVRTFGRPAAVLQLLDRHSRDCDVFAAALGVPHVYAWEGLGGAPFQVLPVRASRFWREVALWEPVGRTLVCAEAVGTAGYYRAPGERIGWHPLVRPFPVRSFGGVSPLRIVVGHGAGIDDGAAGALSELLANGRRRTPSALLNVFRTSSRAAST